MCVNVSDFKEESICTVCQCTLEFPIALAACSNNHKFHLNCFEALLRSGTYSKKCINCTKPFQSYFKQTSSESPKTKHQVVFAAGNKFIQAAETGDLDTIQKMVNSGNIINPSAVERAFSVASLGGYSEIIDFLIKTYPLSEESLEEALVAASSRRGKGRDQIINTLFPRISQYTNPNSLSAIAINSAIVGRFDLFKDITNKRLLPREVLEACLIGAASRGNAELVRHLLKTHDFSAEERGNAYVNAIVGGCDDLAEEIQKKGSICLKHKAFGLTISGVKKVWAHKFAVLALGLAYALQQIDT